MNSSMVSKVEIKDEIYDGSLRLFDTTQKHHYKGESLRDKINRPILPTHNVSTLPTSSYLYSTSLFDL